MPTASPRFQASPRLFAASGDLGNHSGYKQNDPDYEREINIVHDAAIKAGVRLCGPLAWRDRPDFTCFQAGSETGAIAGASKPNWAIWPTRRGARCGSLGQEIADENQ